MNLEKLKELAVPVSERLPIENGMYVTISNIGEKMVESYDKRHKFFCQTEYWIDFDLLTTKAKAEKHAIELIESLKDYTLESQNILGHDERTGRELYDIFLTGNQNKL